MTTNIEMGNALALFSKLMPGGTGYISLSNDARRELFVKWLKDNQ